jgi:hypothetical protein
MSTQWGQDPYGSGNDQYSSGSDPYGSGSDSYSSGSESYTSGSDAFASGGDAYGSGSDPYGSSDDAFVPDFGSTSGGGDPYAAPAAPYSTQSAAPSFGPQFGEVPQGSYGQPLAMAPPSSGLGIAGFILGILALTFCGGLTGPPGLILSIMGMKATAPGAMPPRSGRGLAIAGLVLSILGTLGLLAMVAYVVLMIVLVGTTAGSGY